MSAGGDPQLARPSLEIHLLGRIELAVGEWRQVVSARTQLGLVLCVLARRSNERVSIDELSEVLWPRERPSSYRNVVQVVVSKLRATLDAAGADPDTELLAIDDGYVLRCPVAAVDACTFDALVTEAFQLLGNNRARDARQLLGRAMHLWAEPFGGHEPESLTPYADQLRRRRREAESALLEVDVQLGTEHVAAVERAVEADPLDERLWGFLMIALYRRGRQADALRAFRRARTILAEEVGVEPGPFLRAIEQEVLLQEGPHLEPSADAHHDVRGLAAVPPPAALSEVLYRSGECSALAALLSRSRFVSLVGAPGVGKTTVAAEVARTWTATPVAWLGLGDIDVSTSCVTDIAVRLGVVSESDAHADDHEVALHSLIGDTSVLLVLDNVEHVAGVVGPFVSRLLRSCRNVTVFTTSRRELGEPAERILPLRPFDTEPRAGALSNGGQYLSVQAGLADPDGEETATLNRIAIDLGGIALALDIAAAQIRRLGADVVGTHLDLLPLAGGSRLDEAISWCVDQLQPPTIQLLRCLVHLEAPWPLSRAVDIGARLGMDRPSALFACSTLVEHSLLLAPPGDAGAGDWRILAPVRQHVAAGAGSAGGDLHRAVAETIVAESEAIGALIEGRDQAAGVTALRSLMPDVRSTLAWAVDAQQPALVARLLTSLRAAWWTTGLYADGQTLHQLGALVLDRWRPTDEADVALSIQARASVALVRPGFGAPAQHLDVLRSLLQESLQRAVDPGTISWVAQLAATGVSFTNAGEAEAIECARIALDHARRADDPWLTGWALLASALANGRPDPLGALGSFEEAAASFVTAGDLLSAARVTMFRAHGLRIFGITRDSDVALAQAREWCAAIDAAPVTQLDCELGLAQNLRAGGELDEAARRFRALIPQLTAVGDMRCAAAAEHELAAILLTSGDVDGASALALHASAVLQRAGSEDTDMAAADLVLADVAFHRGDLTGATRLLGRARRGATGAGIPLEVFHLEAMDRLEERLRTSLGDDAFDRSTR